MAFIPYPAAKIERERNLCGGGWGWVRDTSRGKRAKEEEGDWEKRMKEKKVIGLDKKGDWREDSHCRFSSNSRQKLSATLEPAACLCNPRFLRASMFFWLARNVRLAACIAGGRKKNFPFPQRRKENSENFFQDGGRDSISSILDIEFYERVYRKRDF